MKNNESFPADPYAFELPAGVEVGDEIMNFNIPYLGKVAIDNSESKEGE